MSVTSPVIDGAETRFVRAAEILRPYVGCFWVIRAQGGATIRVVPDGGTSISIEPVNPRSPGWVLRGPLVRPQERRFADDSLLIGVRLRPGVARLITGVSADRMVGCHVALNKPDVLRGERTPEEYIDVLQRFLIDRLSNAHVHPVVTRAIDDIQRAQGPARIARIAADCKVSPRHLNRLMRHWVGYGAKRFERIVRFQQTLMEIERAPRRSGADLASDTGYFDQAHMTLDMARLSGATPGRLASHHAADFYKTHCDDPL